MRIALARVVLFLATLAYSQTTSPNSAGNFLQRQQAATGELWAGKHAPMKITASLKFLQMQHGDVQGSWEQRWNSSSEWRDEYQAAGFSELRGRTGSKEWEWSSFPAPFVRILQFRQAIDLLKFPMVAAVKMDAKGKQRTLDGIPVYCFESPGAVSCFDSQAGTLVHADEHGLAFEYRDYQRFGEKLLPRTIRIGGKSPVVEATLTVADSGPADTALFQPPAGAESWVAPNCAGPSGAAQEGSLYIGQGAIQGNAISQPRPEYPERARRNTWTGSVVIWAVIGVDGAVHRPVVTHSAGPELDQAALEAVQKWRYKPYELCGQPVPVETTITINFALGN